MSWQDQYADPKWRDRITKLPSAEEQQFQLWAKNHNAPITDDYDMRGFWKALSNVDPRAITAVNPNDKQLHYPDTWKTPLHESFSGESIYMAPHTKGPSWNPQDQLVAPGGRVLYDEKAQKARNFLFHVESALKGGSK